MRLSWLVGLVWSAAIVAEGARNQTVYNALYQAHSNSTPKFERMQDVGKVAIVQDLRAPNLHHQKRDLPVGTCAPGTPCVNGACCSKTGICGYSPDECGADNCLSNCDAKAQCGQYAPDDSATCPLNVCCSKFGFCGSTNDFCGDGCQEDFGGCGKVDEPFCGGGVSPKRTVGYYESWSSTRDCDSRRPADLDLTGVTHLNFAFAFFNPTTFEITPMNPGDEDLYKEFVSLKDKRPGLQTWISIGGWSFNDATNTPNTQKAFSDMVSTEENRQAFAEHLLNFMQTYGFDGVDIDWEYPGAPDRGGTPDDTENFIHLLEKLRSVFGDIYGISLTLPSSYWYLRWFDVSGLARLVNWFNFMSYDIHGVWDSTNKFTGPYVRPHTNLTEIREGLDLLWRNAIDPQKVTLGLGWYGRSFTLENPACNTPGCRFTAGGKHGECTKSAGTLSNAEIFRIISERRLVPVTDDEAAVQWVTWDDQWVSYDDSVTMALKMDFAKRLCLGGTMVWSVDQDDDKGTSAGNLLGLGDDVSDTERASIKEAYAAIGSTQARLNSCYWSLCSSECTKGFFDVADARGTPNGLQKDYRCDKNQTHTLCCADGTSMGQCEWDGWRGVGMPCNGNSCKRDGAVAIAYNTNSITDIGQLGIIQDETCSGGYQAYCCSDFRPSSKTTQGLALIDQNGDPKAPPGNAGGSVGGCVVGAGLLGGATGVVSAEAIAVLAAPFTLGLSLIFGGAIGIAAAGVALGACLGAVAPAAAPKAIGLIAGQPLQGNGDPNDPTPSSSIGKPKPKGPRITVKPVLGQWTRSSYDAAVDTDCSVTYTCRYGQGFDEVCDNQRWAIDKGLDGRTVYHVGARTGPSSKEEWAAKWRKSAYRKAAQAPDANNEPRCQLDEFPMGSLEESSYPYPQVCRLINGVANRRQGVDYNQWKSAIWNPCAALRASLSKPPPPATWAFGAFSAGDSRIAAASNGQHFLQHYGFDSQTVGSLCWATYTRTIRAPQVQPSTVTSTVTDHGFRALPNDPMFGAPYNWPLQQYSLNPNRGISLPHDIDPTPWLKKRNVKLALEGVLPVELANSGQELMPVPCSACDVVVDVDEQGDEYAVQYNMEPKPVMATTASSHAAHATADARPGSEVASTRPVQTASTRAERDQWL